MKPIHILLISLISLSVLSQEIQFESYEDPLPNKTKCEIFFTNLTIHAKAGNFTPQEELLIINSGHSLNDLGDYLQCQQYNTTRYMLMAAYNDTQRKGIAGLCGPSYCEVEDYVKYEPEIRKQIVKFEPSLENATVEFFDPSIQGIENDGVTVLTIILFATFVGLAVSGTVLKMFSKKRYTKVKDGSTLRNPDSSAIENDSVIGSLMNDTQMFQPKPSLVQRILECFDVNKNIDEVFTKEKNPKHDQNLIITRGLKALAFFWVVFGNTAFLNASYNKNQTTNNDFYNSTAYLNAAGVLYAVTIFFSLSGFFAAFTLVPKLERLPANFATWGKVVLHRLLRLWPAYVFCILLYWKIFVFLGDGPIWIFQVKDSQYCSENWWKTFFLFQNWFTEDGGEYCYSWGWYIATEMQIFLVAPLFCWLYLKNKMFGKIGLIVAIIGSWVAGFIVVEAKSLPYTIPLNTDPDTMVDFYQDPFVNSGPYFIGMFFGFVYRDFKGGDRKTLYSMLKASKRDCYIVFILSLLLNLFIVYFPSTMQDGNSWDESFTYIWMATAKFFYSVAILLILAVVTVGSLRYIKTVLKTYSLGFMSKLSYSGYLVHMWVANYFFFTLFQFSEFSTESAVYKTLSFIMLSLVIGGFVHVLVEKPFINLDKEVINVRLARIIDEDEDESNADLLRGSVRDTN